MARWRTLACALALIAAAAIEGSGDARARAPTDAEVRLRFLALLVGHPDAPSQSIEWLDANWRDDFTAYAVEIIRFIEQRGTTQELLALMARKTGAQVPAGDWSAWMRWQWQQPPPPPAYAAFKADLHANIDPRFAGYFSPERSNLIRLDEVVWGGVMQDGIPPLREPKMMRAGEARYLGEKDVVFGIEINGDARAYPQRILAWHEMFVDRVGGVEVAGVYCTLCGAVIIYETAVDGRRHRLGTSGFLYRSNKLMYDADTQSLWHTLEGRPVIGPLADKSISLPTRDVVTTTWGEWRRRHPSTTVLALATGHQRDYAEGAAYRDYFASDRLMFPVPATDGRLANKAEVLVPRFGRANERPLALASEFLRKHPVWQGRYGERSFVVLTDRSGAHRIYGLPADAKVRSYDGDRKVTLDAGRVIDLAEAALGRDAAQFPRLPSHNAFWFGWHAAHPDTDLVH